MAEKKSSRILTFDLLRGYFLVAIVIDHLHFFPNGLDWLTMRGNLFVTAAEGFFFISGIILGIIRGSRLIKQPFKQVARLLLRRGMELYVTSIILVLAFTLAGWWLFADNPGLKYGILPPTNLGDLLWKTISLQYFYGWADYLRLYAIFLFASPLVLWLLRRGRWYIVLSGSVLLWLLFPTGLHSDPFQELWQPLSWQLIFFGGMTVGFHWQQLTHWWRHLARHLRTALQTGILLAAGITLLVNIWIEFSPIPPTMYLDGVTHEIGFYLYINFFDKEQLPLARVALFLLWFSASFILFRRFEPLIIRTFGWLLLPFGTNSLYVYTIHAFLIFFVHLWLQSGHIAFNFLVSCGIIGLILAMIHYRVLMKIIPR